MKDREIALRQRFRHGCRTGQLCHQLQHVLGSAVRRSKLMWPKCINCVNSHYTLGYCKMLPGVERCLPEYLPEQHKHTFTVLFRDIQVSQRIVDAPSLEELKARMDGALSNFGLVEDVLEHGRDVRTT